MKPFLSIETHIQVGILDVLAVTSTHVVRVIIASCIFWLCSGFLCRATTIVAIVDADRILIGADSLWRNSQLQTKLQCKIGIRRHCVFGITGMRVSADVGFDSDAIATKACSQGGSPVQIAARFALMAREPLSRAIEYSKIHDAAAYERDYRGKTVLEVSFLAFYNNRAAGALKTFLVDERDRLKQMPVAAVPDAQGNGMVVSGAMNAIKRVLRTDETWKTLDHPDLVRSFIGREIADEPDIVGGPVSILEITRTGKRWIMPGVCGSHK